MEVPKRKPKTQNKTQQQMGEQLGLLELRAELEPYLKDNPLARLGFDMIERGEQIGDERSGGEILAGLAGGPQGMDRYIEKDYRGQMFPSSRYKKGFTTTEDAEAKNKGFGSYTSQVLRFQGIESLLPPSKGSTVYYETGFDDPNQRGYDLSILLEELAHLGMRKLQTDNSEFTDLPVGRTMQPDTEEGLMDVMQGRAEAEAGVYSAPGNRDFYISQKSSPLLKGIDQAALKELGMRGVPVQVKPKTSEKLMGLFK